MELLNLDALGCIIAPLPFLSGLSLPVAPLPGQREGAEAFLSAPAFACQEVPGSLEALLALCVFQPLGFRECRGSLLPGRRSKVEGTLCTSGKQHTQRRVVRGQREATQAAGLGAAGTSRTLPGGSPFPPAPQAQPPTSQNFLISSVSSRYSLAEAKMCSLVTTPWALQGRRRKPNCQQHSQQASHAFL